MQSFRSSLKLDDLSRKIIVDAIVTWHITRKRKISRDEFEAIAEDISRRFNDDKVLLSLKINKIPLFNPFLLVDIL